jgi:Transketolase, C-terminal subunit
MSEKTQANAAPALIGSSGDSLREAFGKELTRIADDYPNLVVLDADVAGGTGVHHFRKAYPEKFLQCGIAEQNMVGAASGLAATGLLPVVTGFACFLERAYEQIRLSIGYAHRNVKIVASHPGLDVGPDGGSAQALEDIAAFRAIPGMTVISPADPVEAALATRAILDFEGPVYMRTGRSNSVRLFDDTHRFEIGKGQILRDGSDVTLVACGVEVARALKAAELLSDEGYEARVVNMPTIKPIDEVLLKRCVIETGCLVTCEDHNIYGGLGSAVAEAVTKSRPCPIEYVGLDDTFGISGEPDELAEHFKITAPYIAKAAMRAISRRESLQ